MHARYVSKTGIKELQPTPTAPPVVPGEYKDCLQACFKRTRYDESALHIPENILIMQEFERVEEKQQNNDEFDRVEGREFEDEQMQDSFTERNEHEHAEPIVSKKLLAENNPIMRYRHESWFMPLVGLIGFLLVVALIAIIF
jgi:hypothetical protein